MRIFVTGATGFVGSAVVDELVAAGHKVLGLARSDAGAASLATAGAEAHRGSLEDLDCLRRGAAATDGVIHTGFIHDFSKFKESCEIDRRAIAALASGLEGSSRPLVVTSATGLVAGRYATEGDAPPSPCPNPRVASEDAAVEAAARGVRTMIVRLPQVHGDGDHAFTPLLINLAREKGVAAYVGDGRNRWPAVHRFDAARLYRLVLEKGMQPRYHAVAEEGIALRDVAAVIGRRLNVPVAGKTGEDAAKHFGWFLHFVAMDNLTSSAKTRAELGWDPAGPALLADIDRDVYFKM